MPEFLVWLLYVVGGAIAFAVMWYFLPMLLALPGWSIPVVLLFLLACAAFLIVVCHRWWWGTLQRRTP
jgi:hypothetical protein